VKSRRNVLLISIDTLRPDHLGCYGARGNPTPNFDRLAARGVRFESAYSAVPITTPSHATLFTGTFPPFHGVRSNGSFALSENRTTIAEILGKAGYATGGFVGAFPLDRQFGFAQGFDTYDDQIKLGATSISHFDAERRASTVVDRALDWYGKRDPKRPFFLFVHCYDPHAPYSPPDEWKAKYPEDPYTGEIAYVDEQVGRLLTRLDHDRVLDDTLVVLVSDHGESLGEHGEATHMVFVYDATLRVALVVAGPGVPDGKVTTEPGRLVDVLPTIAALTGLPAPTDVQGVDLAPAWTSKGKLDAERYFYAESMLPQVQFDWAPLQSIRMGKWKYILAPEREFYDLEADRQEARNLYRAGTDGRPRFDDDAQDSAWRKAHHLLEEAALKIASPEAGNAVRDLDPEGAKKLQSLGYLGTSNLTRRTASETMTLPDPKTRIGLFNEIERAGQLGDTGRTTEAIAVYEKLIAEYPLESWIRMSLAQNLMTAKEYEEVLSVLSPATVAALSKDRRTSAMGMRAGAFEELGRWEDALVEWEALVKEGGERVTTAEKGRGNVLVGLKRYSEAIPPLERFTSSNGNDRDGHLLLGFAYLGAGRHEDGMAQLTRVRDLEARESGGAVGRRTPPLLRAAKLYVQLGDRARAASLLTELIAQDPSQARGEAAPLLLSLGVTASDPNSVRIESSRQKRAKLDFAGAAADLEAVVASGGGTASVEYELFVCYLNLGRRPESHEALARCLELDPNFVPALADLGLVLERRGKKEEAEARYRHAIELDRDFYPALSRLGILLARTGRLPEAITMLERAVAVNPGSDEAHRNLGLALKKAGKTAEAEKESTVGKGPAREGKHGNAPVR
jgi:arylsulfatase A-like enzyme/Flp pilus assembly protein TadD